MCPGVENGDGHSRNEDREVQAEGSDPKHRKENGFEIWPLGDIAKPFNQTSTGSVRCSPNPEIVNLKETERAEHGAKRGRVDEEDPT
jgi:hypothetical protein